MADDGGSNRRGTTPLARGEAVEVVVVISLAAAVMVVAAPMVRRIADGQLDRAGIQSALTNIDARSGLLLLLAAGLVATAPNAEVVPLLRSTVVRISAVIAVLGGLAMVLILTDVSALSGAKGVLDRLGIVMARSGPGALLAGAATWLGRRVVSLRGD